MPMTVSRVNAVNVGLILASALCALRFPLETFLAAYAFLGPLHYLTEISWLEQRSYFIEKKRWAWVLVGLCALVIPVAYVVPKLVWVGTLGVMVAFIGSLLFLRTKRTWIDGVIIGLLVLLCGLFFFVPPVAHVLIGFAILLTTIIHVSFFTGMFMLGGALREKGWSALVALMIFALCVLGLIVSGRVFPDWGVTVVLRPLYQDFVMVNRVMVEGFQVHRLSVSALFESSLGLGVMRFIGFAYLYHYLNWFSKTSIIQWHAVSKVRAGFIVLVWLSTVVLYIVDYRAGLLAMLFLSLLHVFLEFPLNWKTLGQITRVIHSRLNQR